MQKTTHSLVEWFFLRILTIEKWATKYKIKVCENITLFAGIWANFFVEIWQRYKRTELPKSKTRILQSNRWQSRCKIYITITFLSNRNHLRLFELKTILLQPLSLLVQPLQLPFGLFFHQAVLYIPHLRYLQ